jgi:putative peptide zinc metalloprotease protein
MTATDETLVLRPAEAQTALARAEGIELLGDVHGSGYEGGAALVRRADGQVVQLGPLLYTLLDSVDGRRTTTELADVLCEQLGRPCDENHVVALAQKLADQGLLAGHEQNAPPRRNPLLALRW